MKVSNYKHKVKVDRSRSEINSAFKEVFSDSKALQVVMSELIRFCKAESVEQLSEFEQGRLSLLNRIEQLSEEDSSDLR